MKVAVITAVFMAGSLRAVLKGRERRRSWHSSFS